MERYPFSDESWTVAETLKHLPSPSFVPIAAPTYVPYVRGLCDNRNRIALAVESMKRHTTDEGWQIMEGLQHVGYTLCGTRLDVNSVYVPSILNVTNPVTAVVQDKREWDVNPKDFRDKSAKFISVESLRQRSDIFKVTILKDAHQRPPYHIASAMEIGCNAWIIYYHPRIVQHLAPYIRAEHLIRTYHSLDAAIVPPYSPEGRAGCLLSGAVSGAYPLRSMLVVKQMKLPQTTYLKHPGYHMQGCHTPEYLKTLSKFKVAICTASMYGYALRKIVEATACGCIVFTDLPSDERLPSIDENLVRVRRDATISTIIPILKKCLDVYDPERQAEFARRAIMTYDYRVQGETLAANIENMRRTYACAQ